MPQTARAVSRREHNDTRLKAAPAAQVHVAQRRADRPPASVALNWVAGCGAVPPAAGAGALCRPADHYESLGAYESRTCAMGTAMRNL